MNITEASKNWRVSRATIYNKIKSGELSKSSDGSIDPAEMVRVFGQPKKKKNVLDTENTVSKIQPFTVEKTLLEQKIQYEEKLRYEIEKRAEEYKERAEKAEAREQALLQQLTNLTDTLKLLEAPKVEKIEPQEQTTTKKRNFFDFFKK